MDELPLPGFDLTDEAQPRKVLMNRILTKVMKKKNSAEIRNVCTQ